MKITINIPNPSRVFNKKIFDCLDDYKTFTEVHYGGASSGKSHGVVQKVVLKSLKDWGSPRKVLWLRKVGASVKDSIFEDVKACLSHFELLDKCKVNESEFRITIPNGARYLFKGLDNPEKIKSIKGISDIVMEEASDFTLDDYMQLILRLRERRHKDKQIYLMFNPVSKLNWTYKTFFLKKPPNTKITQSTYKDNRFLDNLTKANIEELADKNPAYHKIYAEGEFATLDKLVFPKYTREIIDRESVAHLHSFFGLDFGFVNDPSAFIHVKLDERNKKMYVMSEYVKKRMLNDEIARTIQALGYSKERILADSAEQKSVAELRKYGLSGVIGVKKWPDSVINGLQYILQYEIIIDELCVKTIEEFENYTWKKDKNTNEYRNEPVDSYNHCIDAIRYSIQEVIYKNKGKKPVENMSKVKTMLRR